MWSKDNYVDNGIVLIDYTVDILTPFISDKITENEKKYRKLDKKEIESIFEEIEEIEYYQLI